MSNPDTDINHKLIVKASEEENREKGIGENGGYPEKSMAFIRNSYTKRVWFTALCITTFRSGSDGRKSLLV